MKLTWFGGRALRVYTGGEILVVEPGDAPAGVERNELLSGSDRRVELHDTAIPLINAARWRPRPAPRAIDVPSPTEVARIAPTALLIASPGEPPLVLLGAGPPPRFGRWADGAVIVLTSARESLVAEVTVLLDVARPRLVALALDEPTLDTVVQELGEHLQGVGLVSLEPGLALEV